MPQKGSKFVYLERYTKETEIEILKNVDRDPKSFEQDVEAIKKWLNGQPHLSSFKLDDMQIKNFLLANKCSVGNTKLKIDMYFSYRGKHTDIFQNTHPEHPRMVEMSKHCEVLMSPKLGKDLTRLLMINITELNSENFNPLDSISYFFNVLDIKSFEDMSFGNHFFYDAKHVTLGHLTKFTPVLMVKFLNLLEQVYSLKIAGMHIINAPTYLEKFVNFVKPFLKKKLADRICIHPNMESVFEKIDKSVIPSDFGGDNISLAEMQKKMLNAFKEYKPFFDEKENWKIDDKLRPEKVKNDEYLGYQGNFKQLNFD